MQVLTVISIIPPKEENQLHIARLRLLGYFDSPFIQIINWY